jgi:hypothetical protein
MTTIIILLIAVVIAEAVIYLRPVKHSRAQALPPPLVGILPEKQRARNSEFNSLLHELTVISRYRNYEAAVSAIYTSGIDARIKKLPIKAAKICRAFRSCMISRVIARACNRLDYQLSANYISYNEYMEKMQELQEFTDNYKAMSNIRQVKTKAAFNHHLFPRSGEALGLAAA